MSADSLYREDVYTDQRVGTIRRMTPVKSDGSEDPSRPLVFVGQATIMTPMGSLPLTFERVTTGRLTAKSRVDLPITFERVVAGNRVTFGAVTLPLTFERVTTGRLTLRGRADLPLTFERVTVGKVHAYADVAFPILFERVVAGTRSTRSSCTSRRAWSTRSIA